MKVRLRIQPNHWTKNQDFSIPLKKIKKKIGAEVEKELITLALLNTDYNITKASKVLGVSLKYIYSKIKELDIKTKPDVDQNASELRLFDGLTEFKKSFLESIDFDNTFEPAAESIGAG